jgi:glycosyltransferase involved in cell wall biosynthesis
MKIGIDVRCLMQEHYSGVSWYTYSLLRAMMRMSQDNEYILFYNNSKDIKMPVFDSPQFSYRKFNYPNKLLNSSFNFFDLPQVDKMIGPVDAFFMPNINFISLSDKCKKVITVHDLSYLRYPHFWTVKSRLWHKTLLYKQILQKADAIIAVSHSTKTDLIELLNIPSEKIKVIHEGVSDKFRPVLNQVELARVKKKYNLPAKFILYLATLEPRKNVDGIIDAYNKLGLDVPLIIGGGVGWKSRRIQKLAAKNTNIRLVGYVDEIDKRALYTLSNLFVYPSYYEGFGLPPLEAMACGTPVIAGANSSQLEVLGSAGLLVDPHNVEDIAQAIDVMLSDDSLREKMIDNGLLQSSKFNWQEAAINTLQVLKS